MEPCDIPGLLACHHVERIVYGPSGEQARIAATDAAGQPLSFDTFEAAQRAALRLGGPVAGYRVATTFVGNCPRIQAVPWER